jgi:tetratricopeptide (TPR) repeat protein
MATSPRGIVVSVICFLALCPLGHVVAQGPLPPSFIEAMQREGRDSQVRHQIGQLEPRIRARPTDPAPLLERAELYGKLGEKASVAADLDAAIRIARNDVETLDRAASIMVSVDPVAAILYYDRLLERLPGNVTVLVNRGRAHGITGDFARARADLDAALRKDPRDALALALTGSLLLQEAKLREAIAAYDRSIDSQPMAFAYFDRGFCHQGLGDYAAAVADYTAAHEMDRSNIAVICERGQAHQLGGAYHLAVRDYEECRAKTPGNNLAALQLSWLLSTCPDAGVRDGRRALDLAAEVCDPVTCRTPEPLNALAAAYAELGDFTRAKRLQSRAVAMSSFSAPLREASVLRLRMLERREPVRESAPLRMEPRAGDGSIHAVTVDEAMSFPADVLGLEMLDVESVLETCVLARAGATIHSVLGGQVLTITADSVNALEPRMRERRDVFEKAIRRRGFATVAEGYTATRKGDCDNWELGDSRVLVEQDGFRVALSQGAIRHRAVVVESAVVLRHDSNTEVLLPGEIVEGVLTFVTSARGGVTGMATERCTLVLTPAKVEGKAWAEPFAGRAIARQRYGEHREALADFERSLKCEQRPEFASLMSLLLAASSDEAVRDGRRAVEAALLAKRLSGDDLHKIVLSALAVSHAEIGDFETAIRYQRQLISRAPEEEREFLKEQLALLEAGRPYHEPASP